MELSKRDRERDKRLQKNYRWTLEMRNKLAELQGNKCAVCGRPESDEMPLNLDHVHFHVQAKRIIPSDLWFYGKWVATVREFPDIRSYGLTKKAAIEGAKEFALPLSVRGLLCPGRYAGCNRLMGRIDKIEWLEKVLAYLKNPPAKQILDKSGKP